MDYGLIVSVIYAAIYGSIFFVTSIYCALEVLEERKRSNAHKGSKAQAILEKAPSDPSDDAHNSQSDKPEMRIAVDDRSGRAETVTQDEAKHPDTANDSQYDKWFVCTIVNTTQTLTASVATARTMARMRRQTQMAVRAFLSSRRGPRW